MKKKVPDEDRASTVRGELAFAGIIGADTDKGPLCLECLAPKELSSVKAAWVENGNEEGIKARCLGKDLYLLNDRHGVHQTCGVCGEDVAKVAKKLVPV